ncbi:MAG: translocation protein TolB, partial [Bdellovibrio sp.]
TFFQILAPSAYLEDPNQTGLRPKSQTSDGFSFEKWKASGAEFLIRGGFSLNAKELILEIYAYSIPNQKLILGKKYSGPSSSARKLVHSFSNDLLQELTGKQGMFLSRIVVSSDRAGGSHREIFVMDWDGANPEQITRHQSISFSPAWSPDGKSIVYTSYALRAKTKTRNPDLFVYELSSRKRWLISYRAGMNSGAHFLPDSKSLVATLSNEGSPDLFQLDLDGRILAQLTKGPLGSLNVEPAVSPDGKRLAFASDRSGKPMIYLSELQAGGTARRLTFAGKYNATPAWSPDGKSLAFAGWLDDHFDIFTIGVDGKDLRKITEAQTPRGRWAHHEDPVFSPDGRLLMYTSNRSGKRQIYVSDLEGRQEWPITKDSFNYYRPRWSQNLESSSKSSP